jgi:putative nucleotidyltransferase with HDIG domain
MLANSQGQDLINHLKATANLSKAMGEYIGLSSEIVNKIYSAGLLHDIGKSLSYIQKYLKKKYNEQITYIIEEDNNDPIIDKPFHNEAGWAFLTTKIIDDEILNTVYWHHAKKINIDSNKKYDTSDIINGYIKEEVYLLNNLFDELKKYIPQSIKLDFIDKNRGIPNLFNNDKIERDDNSKFMIVRACVISADRHVSTLDKNGAIELANNYEFCRNVVENMMSGSIVGDIKLPYNYDIDRFNLQNKIVEEDIGSRKTSLIKAPAGFGKSMIGVLWARKQSGKSIWVCPRNTVAISVYNSIKKEVQVLNLNCSIELYLTGERKETNIEDNREPFDSDIIVTNIDALLSPMVNNRVAGRLFSVYSSNVVLDEFHEFVSDAPLFAAFLIYMKARVKFTNCKTLLLSATPMNISILWDGEKDDVDRTTLILPSKNTHYPPQHDKKYKANFIDSLPIKAVGGSLLVCNSVTEAQNNFRNGYTYIVHHNYTENDRNRKDKEIYDAFSKNGKGIERGESVSAALVVQAAMDISFNVLYDSVSSPESTLQRIGRENRWGILIEAIINFIDLSKQSNERGAISSTYNLELQKKWFIFLKDKIVNESYVNLEQMYNMYNEFYEINKKELRIYVEDRYTMSIESLVDFKPIKFINIKEKKIKKYGKSLRSPEGSWFFTVEVSGEVGKWVEFEDVLSCNSDVKNKYSGNSNITEKYMNTGYMESVLKELVNCGYVGWGKYVKSNKKCKLPSLPSEWFKKARNCETALPDICRKYDRDLGVIKKDN